MPAKWDASALTRAIQRLPGQIHDNVARGAAKAFAAPIVEDARQRCRDEEVAASLKAKTRVEPDAVVVTIGTSGKGAYKAPWLEYGTKPHFISVAAADSGGRTVGRINRLNKAADREGSLRIGGNFVGPVVHHPGAKETKFLRPAIDSQWEAAVAAASAYFAKRMTAGDLNRPAPADEDQA